MWGVQKKKKERRKQSTKEMAKEVEEVLLVRKFRSCRQEKGAYIDEDSDGT